MKIPKLLSRKKLQAATARRPTAASAEMGYEEMSEPNMKLSRALLIVLLLHVVAVSGIIAFNAIKTRQSSFVPATPANTENDSIANVGSTIKSDGPNPRSALARKEILPRDEAKASHSPSKQLAKDEHLKSTEHPKVPAPARSGKVYTVVKGDNPVTIAKKLKVSYDDLIALNHIEDPRKLKIGQKLLVPKTTKAKDLKKPKKTNE
jgi:LysM repeat protein